MGGLLPFTNWVRADLPLEASQGTVSGQKQELLFTQFGINYNNLEPIFRKGSTLVWQDEAPPPPAETEGEVSPRPLGGVTLRALTLPAALISPPPHPRPRAGLRGPRNILVWPRGGAGQAGGVYAAEEGEADAG